jgi:hypothetical protein
MKVTKVPGRVTNQSVPAWTPSNSAARVTVPDAIANTHKSATELVILRTIKFCPPAIQHPYRDPLLWSNRDIHFGHYASGSIHPPASFGAVESTFFFGKPDSLTNTLDHFLKRLTDTEEEFVFMKHDVNRIKAVLREKLGVSLD